MFTLLGWAKRLTELVARRTIAEMFLEASSFSIAATITNISFSPQILAELLLGDCVYLADHLPDCPLTGS